MTFRADQLADAPFVITLDLLKVRDFQFPLGELVPQILHRDQQPVVIALEILQLGAQGGDSFLGLAGGGFKILGDRHMLVGQLLQFLALAGQGFGAGLELVLQILHPGLQKRDLPRIRGGSGQVLDSAGTWKATVAMEGATTGAGLAMGGIRGIGIWMGTVGVALGLSSVSSSVFRLSSHSSPRSAPERSPSGLSGSMARVGTRGDKAETREPEMMGLCR